ncbi:MAG TPA: TetR/AcrR family transcriptional regulator [Paludibacteraceae bacterium]|mgnify:CR=1 FL=1|nr:TetR/AcrR family transcriptional regulator [Paludibacteraceae bacterium]
MEVKDKILKTASELFLKYGLRSVSIDDICNDLRISKKTFYVHFKQKEELVESLLVQMRCKHNNSFDKLSEEHNVIDMLLNDTSRFKSSGMAEKHINFFYDLQKYYPEISTNHDVEMHNRQIKQTQQVLCKGVEQGWFRADMNVDAMAIFIHVRFSNLFQELREQGGLTIAQAVDFMLDAFFRLVTTEQGLEYYLSKKIK